MAHCAPTRAINTPQNPPARHAFAHPIVPTIHCRAKTEPRQSQDKANPRKRRRRRTAGEEGKSTPVSPLSHRVYPLRNIRTGLGLAHGHLLAVGGDVKVHSPPRHIFTPLLLFFAAPLPPPLSPGRSSFPTQKAARRRSAASFITRSGSPPARNGETQNRAARFSSPRPTLCAIPHPFISFLPDYLFLRLLNST